MSLKNKIFIVSLSSIAFLGLILLMVMTNRMNVYQSHVIEDLRSTMMAEKKEKLQAVIDTAYSTLQPVFSTEKGDELKRALSENVKNLRFIEGNPNSYFYIHDKNGVVIAHGSNPKNVGKSQWDLKNSKNQYIVRNIVKSAISGDGFTIFDGYKPTEDAFFPKMTFSRYIKSHGYALTTGFYIDDIEKALVQKKEKLDSDYHTLMITVIAVTIIMALLLSALAYLLISRATKPLEEIGNQLEELSAGNGDLTVRLPVRGNDEIGKVAQAFNGFVSKLQETIQQLSDISQHLAGNASHVEKKNLQAQSQIDRQLEQVNMVATAIEEMSSQPWKLPAMWN